MAGVDALEIFREIQALVSDKLQVVSYKWLSRNFSVSSNYAKRLLKEFVEKHGNELEVVYTLAGWLKIDPQMYCVKLVSRLNLPEVKQEFMDKCSVQVYSVQACIPKDLALLWSAEFVQAEELFSQPSTTENCLRDNRFCGVSNSYVKRTVDGKSASAVSQLKTDSGISVRPKTGTTFKDPASAPQQGSVAQSSAKNGIQSSSMVNSSSKSERIPSVVNNQTTKPKEALTTAHTNKNKGKNETSSGGGSSIASLWGRASTKSKSSGPAVDTTCDVPNIAISAATAEALICAREAADAMSSDDEADINYRRELNGASNRKRRVVIDFSDEDEENVVSLASPGPPTVKPGSDYSQDTEILVEKKNPSLEDHKEDNLEVKQDKSKERLSGLSGINVKVGNHNDITGISLQKKTENGIAKDVDDVGKKANSMINASSTSPKRRKVLKTRIDERGREVTEVVWEGEAAVSNPEKSMTKNDSGNRPPVAANKAQAAKAQPAGNNAPTNPTSKAANKKPAKGGAKDVKQGNILSFFKKV